DFWVGPVSRQSGTTVVVKAEVCLNVLSRIPLKQHIAKMNVDHFAKAVSELDRDLVMLEEQARLTKEQKRIATDGLRAAEGHLQTHAKLAQVNEALEQLPPAESSPAADGLAV
ncbi:unnamed protein product, partial [Symbiodinium sp. CCMP2592]